MEHILYGKPVKEKIKRDLIERIKMLGRKPVLVIIQVGDRADSTIYIGRKVKFAEEIGAEVVYKKCDEKIKEEKLIEEIEKINQDKNIDGIIIQLPLPENLNREKVLASIDWKKDADGLSGLDLNGENVVTPATARAVEALLDFYNIEVKDKNVTVIGRSKLAGGPIAKSLEERRAKITVCHKETPSEIFEEACKSADVLVVAAGSPGLITKDLVNEKQVVIDVGINRVEEKIVGDVAFEEVEPIVSAITPVPGGVGPLTVACLFQNLLDLIN